MSLTHCSGGLHQKAMKSSLISSSSWMLGRLLKNLFFISIYSVCVKIILSLLSVPVRLLLQVLRESFKYEQTTSERVPLVFMQKVHFFLSFHEQYPFATAVVPMHQFFFTIRGTGWSWKLTPLTLWTLPCAVLLIKYFCLKVFNLRITWLVEWKKGFKTFRKCFRHVQN